MNNTLEKVITNKISPLLANSKNEHIDISKLYENITSHIKRGSIFDIEIDLCLNFKNAKKEFKKCFLTNMIKKNYGNISEVARITDINRRSIHRIIDDKEIRQIRSNLPKRDTIIYNELCHAIDTILLTNDHRFINKDKLKNIYDSLSRLPDETLNNFDELTFKEAEIEFEKKYIKEALLKYNHDICITANQIGIRSETLYRKIKNLELASLKSVTI